MPHIGLESRGDHRNEHLKGVHDYRALVSQTLPLPIAEAPYGDGDFMEITQPEGSSSETHLSRGDARLRFLLIILVAAVAANTLAACNNGKHDSTIGLATKRSLTQTPIPTSTMTVTALPTATFKPTTPPELVPQNSSDRILATQEAGDPTHLNFERVLPRTQRHREIVEQYNLERSLQDGIVETLEIAINGEAIIIWSVDPESPLFLPVPPDTGTLKLAFDFMTRSASFFPEVDRPQKLPIILLVDMPVMSSLSIGGTRILIPEFSTDCDNPFIIAGFDPENPIASALAWDHEFVHKWMKLPEQVKEIITRAYAELIFGYDYLTRVDQERFYQTLFNGRSPLGPETKGYTLAGFELWLRSMNVSLLQAISEIINKDGYGSIENSENPLAMLGTMINTIKGDEASASCIDHSRFFIELNIWYEQHSGRSLLSLFHEYTLRLLVGKTAFPFDAPIPAFDLTAIPTWKLEDEGEFEFPAEAMAGRQLENYSTSMFLLPLRTTSGSIAPIENFEISIVPVHIDETGNITATGGLNAIQTAQADTTLQFTCPENGQNGQGYLAVLTYGDSDAIIMLGVSATTNTNRTIRLTLRK